MARKMGFPAAIPIIMAANISRKCSQNGGIRILRLTVVRIARCVPVSRR